MTEATEGALLPPTLAFARDFFLAHGAKVETLKTDSPRLLATLSPELADHFDLLPPHHVLSLGSDPQDETAELVAPGSRCFDRMLTWLAGRGRLASFRAIQGNFPPPQLRAVVGVLTPLGAQEAVLRHLVYDFLVAHMTDERQETICTVALDEKGQPTPAFLARLNQAIAFSPTDWQDVASSNEAAEWRHLAEAEARRQAEIAAQPIEVAAAERLTATATRLEGYYQALINEVGLKQRRPQGDDQMAWEAELEAERQALQQELARRIAVEARQHQLRVSIRLLGMAAIALPQRRFQWRLLSAAALPGHPPTQARLLEALQDLASGEVKWPNCERCGQPTREVGLCSHAHAVCPACLVPCAGCGAPHCQAELEKCLICAEGRCPACLGTCHGVTTNPAHPPAPHVVCRSHLAPCACCGVVFCRACAPACPTCANPVARGHRCFHPTPPAGAHCR